ncbi:hypothetical protein SX4_2422 [Vibrio mimicus SX-4]|nr:hypothetical protein SX4_2422 [Vibrio mimicus SX-4]
MPKFLTKNQALFTNALMESKAMSTPDSQILSYVVVGMGSNVA